MKNKSFLPVILLAGFMLFNFSGIRVYGQTQNQPTQQQTVKYTCPVHTEVVKDQPGVCPICGRTLVEKTDKMMNKGMDTTLRKSEPRHMNTDTTLKKKTMKADTTYRK